MYSINKTLGQGYSLRVILSSLAVAIIILFYTLTVASYFEPDVYRFEDRTTYHQYFRDQYIINVVLDNAVLNSALIAWIYLSFVHRTKWVILSLLGTLCLVGSVIWGLEVIQIISISSLPFILAVYMLYKKSLLKRVVRIDSNYLTLNYFLISFTTLAVVSIFISMSNGDVQDPFIDMITFFSRFTPLIMVLLIFSVFVRMILKEVLSKIPQIPVKVKTTISLNRVFEQFEPSISDTKSEFKIILLSSFMALSVLMVLIPHLEGLHNSVAEDTSVYADWLEPMQNSDDLFELLRLAFVEIRGATTGDRPLTLLILNGLSFYFDTVIGFEIILPAFLAPLLVLTIYFLTKEITSNTTAALFSSLITAVSFHVMIGMYAGFYATWIALIFGFLALLFGIRFLNNQDKTNLIWLFVSMIVVLLSHVYTWTLVTTFFVIYLLVARWKGVHDSRSIKIVLLVIFAVIGVDLLRSYLIGLGTGLERDVVIAESFNFGLQQLGSSWSNIVRAAQVFLGGIFGNVIILSLALYCAILIRYGKASSFFLIVFLSLGILPLLFGDKIVQSRVLYIIPFQIPAALALTNIFTTRYGKLISTTIVISLLAISVYTMNNLGVSPR
jgi:Dolichyl-phosphate-mannose-protein mannosyltransferase